MPHAKIELFFRSKMRHARDKPDIPHREPNLDAFASIKPAIPLSQELAQVQVLVG